MRLVDQARVEVDVRVQLAIDEVRVGQCGLFELECDVEQRVLAGDFEDLVGGLFDDRGPRVEVLVDPVPEAHEATFAVLDRIEEGRHVVDRADLGEHPDDGLVRAAVQRAVERGCGAGRRRVRVGMAGADDAHRGRAAVLLVVGVQDEQHVHRPLEDRVDLVVADLPHHVEEVGRVRQVVARLVVGQADRELVAHRRDRRALGDEAADLDVALLGIVDLLGRRCRRCRVLRWPTRTCPSGERRSGSPRRTSCACSRG